MSEEQQPAPGPGEDFKVKGNDAFAKKDFDEAIKLYTEALKLEPNNPVYYSNRSACYFSKKQWQAALEDALQCVDKDSKFIKGYLRLVSAQIELGKFEDAETTLKAALTLDPSNELIGRKIKELKSRKSGTGVVGKRPAKQLSAEQQKELGELQEQWRAYDRDLRGVALRISSMEREMRTVQVTSAQLKDFDDSTAMYKSVGKAYVLSNKSAVDDSLKKEADTVGKNLKDLQDRKEYLERRITSSAANIRDLTQ
jgi:tetratricopeptide (TPR) repeat protein